MLHGILSPNDVRAADTALQWARSYLTPEHPAMRRPQGSRAVCPFVGAALQNDSLFVAVHSEFRSPMDARRPLEAVMRKYISRFHALGSQRTSDRWKKALLVVFPGLDEADAIALDAVQRRVKTRYVTAGLMLGQFHPRCADVSVHNDSFRVSVAPLPLIAIRNMARHDILFLHGRQRWFLEYQKRFESTFTETPQRGGDEHYLAEHFWRAKRRFDPGRPDEAPAAAPPPEVTAGTFASLEATGLHESAMQRPG